MARFTLAPGLERRLARSVEIRAALRRRATQAAAEAQRIGRETSSSYTATVDDAPDGEGVRVEANTGGINAASWIEFGTSKLPASAPLRRGAESAGLNLRAK